MRFRCFNHTHFHTLRHVGNSLFHLHLSPPFLFRSLRETSRPRRSPNAVKTASLEAVKDKVTLESLTELLSFVE